MKSRVLLGSITLLLALTLVSIALPVAAPVAIPPTKVIGYGWFTSDGEGGSIPGHNCFFYISVKFVDGECCGYGWFVDKTSRMTAILKITCWEWGWSGEPPLEDIVFGGTAKIFEGWKCVSKEFEIRLVDGDFIGFWDKPETYWVRGTLSCGRIMFCWPTP